MSAYLEEQTLPIYVGVDAPPTASMCQSGDVEHHFREASGSKVITIGLDIAKHVFHVHGADERGRAVFSRLAEQGCWISSRLSRVAPSRWRHVAELITGLANSFSSVTRLG